MSIDELIVHLKTFIRTQYVAPETVLLRVSTEYELLKKSLVPVETQTLKARMSELESLLGHVEQMCGEEGVRR